MKRNFIIIFVLMLLPSGVLARSKTSCDYTLLANLKKLSSNVNATYTYKVIDDVTYFDITLTNIQNDIYFVDNNTNKTYYYSDTNNGVITISDYYSGKVSYTFYSNNSECLDEVLSVKNINLPYYNKYYSYDECINNVDSKLCQRWSNNEIDYYNFIENVGKYKENIENNVEETMNSDTWFDKLVNIYLNYYYIVVPSLIITIVILLYVVKWIRYRKNRFNI